eukprot:scaffold96651_cov65-Phaeocystis_antarctica.AAC.2
MLDVMRSARRREPRSAAAARSTTSRSMSAPTKKMSEPSTKSHTAERRAGPADLRVVQIRVRVRIRIRGLGSSGHPHLEDAREEENTADDEGEVTEHIHAAREHRRLLVRPAAGRAGGGGLAHLVGACPTLQRGE